MKKVFSATILGLSLIILAGCAGTRFTRISSEQAHLGVDTTDMIRAKMGKPYQEGKVIKNGKTVKVLSYTYAHSSAGASFGVSAVPSKTQVFYFSDNILVGHLYTSTNDNDRTEFNSLTVEKIKKGETKIDEAVALLGFPSGEYMYPLVDKENEKAKIYCYVQLRTTPLKWKLYQQVLTIAYDSSGVVTKVDFVETGEK